MPDDKKIFKKTREERQQDRIDKFTKARKEEAKKAGIDMDKTIDIGPLGPERQARINAEINKGVEGDIKAGLEKIQSLRQPPEVEVPEKPTTEYDIKDVRRRRRAKLGDVLTSFSQGYSGRTVTPTVYRDRLRDQTLNQYQQYKDTATAAKKTLDDWQTNYINDQLNYLDKMYVDPYTSDLQKLKIKEAKARSQYQQNLANKAASPKSTADKYDTISYETSDGETIRMQVPSGGEDLSKRIAQDKELKQQIAPLDSKINEYTDGISKLEKELDKYTYKENLSELDKVNLNVINSGIAKLKSSIKDLEARKEALKKGESQPEKSPKQKTQAKTENTSDSNPFSEIVNKYSPQ